MKREDVYETHKGQQFKVISIAVPTKDKYIDETHLIHFYDAKHYNSKCNFKLLTCSDGCLFIESEHYYVVFYSIDDKEMKEPITIELDDFYKIFKIV